MIQKLYEYLNDMDHIYKIIEEYNPNNEWKILIVSDDMIAHKLSNKKLNPGGGGDLGGGGG